MLNSSSLLRCLLASVRTAGAAAEDPGLECAQALHSSGLPGPWRQSAADLSDPLPKGFLLDLGSKPTVLATGLARRGASLRWRPPRLDLPWCGLAGRAAGDRALQLLPRHGLLQLLHRPLWSISRVADGPAGNLAIRANTCHHLVVGGMCDPSEKLAGVLGGSRSGDQQSQDCFERPRRNKPFVWPDYLPS